MEKKLLIEEKEEEVFLQADLFSYVSTLPHVLTVSELTLQIKHLLEGQFPRVSVRGEISNLRTPSSGHSYFSLKDATSQLAAVFFRPYQQGLKFALQDGLDVIVTGQISVYEARGNYQLLVETIEPVGIGSLQLAFEQLKKKLAAEGLFDAAHKKPIPFLPQRIAVITSPTGAAIRDILNVLHRRFSTIEVLVIPVSVQGKNAAPEIADAVGMVNRLCKDVDVILLSRGGGSLEDLASFNEEMVARAIFASVIPVISAVGHEIDFTISDFVADLRAPTPSAAAELVVQNKTQLSQRIDEQYCRLKQAMFSILQNRSDTLDYLTKQLVNPLSEIGIRQDKISHLKDALLLQMNKRILLTAAKLEGLSRLLQSLNPREILKRGFAIAIRKKDASVLRTSKDAVPGDFFELILSQGKLLSRVESKLE